MTLTWYTVLYSTFVLQGEFKMQLRIKSKWNETKCKNWA